MSQLKTIAVENAPKAIGPYAQGIVAGGFLFTAGQVHLDPATMKLVSGTIAEETNQVFDNLQAVLAGAGCTLADVVKTTVFLTDMGTFAEMNGAYAARFGDHRPARSTVQVGALPGNGRVEIELIAKLPGA
ncbi:MAG TPA: RidA family protein [Thermoanaerobaculia bacterium]|jgi:2-iminobutanoate/2-iminopropanoate deaminase|nr:RidA family protein [Thermoanaerobaculia bacterium]HPA53045.1 RidA family protein [Thermoanaerobaculia bacterium]HQN08679.1 RidA family protein [Thermoanaerobaculia bacterium]HQP86143.1 RidA family protein [Thermoanaerobaculia bacterium]